MMLVGGGLLPPFIKISFCLKRTVEDAGPYRI